MGKKGKERGKSPKKGIKEGAKLVDEYKERCLRLQAEFENYRKQLDREKSEFMQSANESLIKDLLIVLDDFENSLQEIKKKDKELSQGMELIYKNFYKILEQRGLESIRALGKKFDPYYHEALMKEEAKGKEDDLVIEEFQKGYMLNKKVIRHSKVKVSKKKE